MTIYAKTSNMATSVALCGEGKMVDIGLDPHIATSVRRWNEWSPTLSAQ